MTDPVNEQERRSSMKVALVTGATRGIGKVVATTLAASSFAVVVTGRTLRRGEGNLGVRGSSEPVPGSIEETVAERSRRRAALRSAFRWTC